MASISVASEFNAFPRLVELHAAQRQGSASAQGVTEAVAAARGEAG